MTTATANAAITFKAVLAEDVSRGDTIALTPDSKVQVLGVSKNRLGGNVIDVVPFSSNTLAKLILPDGVAVTVVTK